MRYLVNADMGVYTMTTDKEKLWLAQSNPQEVTPIADSKPHESGPYCQCMPFYQDEVLVHNSFDGREKHEKVQ